MEIYLSIDGVLRNTIQKFDYHYKNSYLESDLEDGNSFEYGILDNVYNDSLFNYYRFQSKEEFDYFLYVEFPIEIFGMQV